MGGSLNPMCLFLLAFLHMQVEISVTSPARKSFDIKLDNERDVISSYPSRERIRRKAMSDYSRHWPDATIPYVIQPSVSNISSKATEAVLSAMKHWSENTCVKFVEYNSTTHGGDFLSIRASKWCESQIGHLGGEQRLDINKRCLSRGVIIHEMGHTVGLIHEHNRPDRDDYIIIQWTKIKTTPSNYEKRSGMLVNTYGLPYDFKSVMQYRAIVDELLAKDPRKQHLMGQRNGLSFLDKKLVNLMYQCDKNCPLDIKCNSPGFINFRCECICPEGSDSCNTIPDVVFSKLTPPKNKSCRWSYRRGLLVTVPPTTNASLVISVRSFTECKLRCLEQKTFQCVSVYYEINRNNPWLETTRKCYLQGKAGTPGKLRFIRRDRMYFIETPVCIRQADFCDWEKKDGIVLYHDDKFSKLNYDITFDECKMNCLEESDFLCMSFMYRRVRRVNTVCIHTSRTVGTVAKEAWGTVPGVAYYERKPCKRTER